MNQLLEDGLDNKAENFAERVAKAVVKQLGAVAPPPGRSAPESFVSEALSQHRKKEEDDAS